MTLKHSARPSSAHLLVQMICTICMIYSHYSSTVHDLDLSRQAYVFPISCDPSHVAGCEPYNLHHLEHGSFVGSVPYRSCTTSHNSRRGTTVATAVHQQQRLKCCCVIHPRAARPRQGGTNNLVQHVDVLAVLLPASASLRLSGCCSSRGVQPIRV